MDVPAHHQPASLQILRDRLGFVIGRAEEQRSTSKSITRDARDLLVVTCNSREGTTRDDRGSVVADGDVLAVRLIRR